MKRTDKILVAGAAGMVDSALVRALLAQGFGNTLGTIHRKAPNFGPGDAGQVRQEPLNLMDQMKNFLGPRSFRTRLSGRSEVRRHS